MEKLIKLGNDAVRALGSHAHEVWGNEIYLVEVVRERHTLEGRRIVRLSIERHDGKTIELAWQDKQAIKNQLVGPECEGISLYPAESRFVDPRNKYNLWVIDDPTFRFPLGFTGPRATWDHDKGELVKE